MGVLSETDKQRGSVGMIIFIIVCAVILVVFWYACCKAAGDADEKADETRKEQK